MSYCCYLFIFLPFLFCFTVFSSKGWLELVSCLLQLLSFWASRAELSSTLAKASPSSSCWNLCLHDSWTAKKKDKLACDHKIVCIVTLGTLVNGFLIYCNLSFVRVRIPLAVATSVVKELNIT